MSEVREVESRRRRLIVAFENAGRLDGTRESAELQADYARYLCVLVSGFIERSVAEIVFAYAQGRGSRPLVSFVEAAMRRHRNLNKERLLDVIGSLDATWRDELDAYIVDERQEAINSVIGLRNDIAHGGGATVSFVRMAKYWEAVQEVVDRVTDIVLRPQRPGPTMVRGGRARARQ